MQNRTAKHSTVCRYGTLCMSVSHSHSLSLPGGVSLWKLRREIRSPLQHGCQLMSSLSLQPTYSLLCLLLRWHPCSSTQGQAIFHRRCLQIHALLLHHLNPVDHPLPCCSSSLRICQNLTSPHLIHPPSLSSY